MTQEGTYSTSISWSYEKIREHITNISHDDRESLRLNNFKSNAEQYPIYIGNTH